MSFERNKLLDVIRKKCLDCSAYSYVEVKDCQFTDCPLFPFREGKWRGGIRGAGRIRLLQAIRKKCLDCCANSLQEVRRCPVRDCPLYKFRFGKFPQ